MTYTFKVTHISPEPEYSDMVEADNLDELAMLVAWKLQEKSREGVGHKKMYERVAGAWSDDKWIYVVDRVFWIGHEMRIGKPAA